LERLFLYFSSKKGRKRKNKNKYKYESSRVGATGLVGTKMIQVLEERNFPVTELIPVASEKIGWKGTFRLRVKRIRW
jgi:hypothetical protein